MIVGSFGEVVFETSDKRVLTPSDFRRDVSVRLADHDLLGVKPATEYIGPGLDSINFTLVLMRVLGYEPDEMIDLFINYCRNGQAYPLVIGEKGYGVDKWIITNLGIPINQISNGVVVSAKLEISLKEYVESI